MNNGQFKKEQKLIRENSTYGATNIQIKKVNIDNDELKTTLFKLAVVKLMLEYDLCISHDREQGFKIIPYNQNEVECFTDSKFNKK